MHRRMTASCPRKAGMDGTSDAATRAFRLNSAQSVAPLPCPCSPRGSSSPPPAPTTPQGPNPSSRASPHEDVYPEFSPPRPSTVSCQLRLLRVSWNPMHVLSLRIWLQSPRSAAPAPHPVKPPKSHPNFQTPASRSKSSHLQTPANNESKASAIMRKRRNEPRESPRRSLLPIHEQLSCNLVQARVLNPAAPCRA